MIKSDVRQVDNCCGCMACVDACSLGAICPEEDLRGFIHPSVDDHKCIACGKCMSICPQSKLEKKSDTLPLEQYAAKHIDREARSKSRSGGVFAALGNVVFQRGGVVFGAVMTDELKVVHKLAACPEQMEPMCGSKYVQSNTNGVFSAVKAELQSGKEVLFCGTPCQCEAVSNFCCGFDNLTTCDFVCHGVPSQAFFDAYISFLEKKIGEPVSDYCFRDKEHFSWGDHVERVSFGNDFIYSRRFANLYSSNRCLRPSCYTCRFASKRRSSDITLADYWGIDAVLPDFDEGQGASLVLVRSEKGRDLFDQAKDQLVAVSTFGNEPTHYNLSRPTSMPDDVDHFWMDYQTHGFEYVSKKYGQYDFLRLAKRFVLDGMDRRRRK